MVKMMSSTPSYWRRPSPRSPAGTGEHGLIALDVESDAGLGYYPGKEVGQAFQPDSEPCQAGKPDLVRL